MRAAIIQPGYPEKGREADAFEQILYLLSEISDADIIVLPEYSNIPGLSSPEQIAPVWSDQTHRLEKAIADAAERCRCPVSANMFFRNRNVTRFFDRSGSEVFSYCKQHLTAAEKGQMKLDCSYQTRPGCRQVFEYDGVRYGFMTCYDVYFNEFWDALALQKPDVVIISSYQRGEYADVIDAEVRLLAQRCNASVLRASYAAGTKGGCSMIAGSDGRIRGNLGQETGVLYGTVSPEIKYSRPNGFGQPFVGSDEFVENGRTPNAYRPCGPFVCETDRDMPYPRLCAHRGLSSAMPENTLPALGAAVALGAGEIEFDVWFTSDGVPVISHDPTLERVSDGEGKIYEKNWDYIQTLDCGGKFSPEFSGLRFAGLEEVLRRFARHTVMNIHVKTPDDGKRDMPLYDTGQMRKIYDLISEYDCAQHCYIGGERSVLRAAGDVCPDIPRAALDGPRDGTLIDLAIEFGCRKAQLIKGCFDDEMIARAKAAGIVCNLFWSDDPAEAEAFLDRGIDTVLTNRFITMKNNLKKRDRYHA